ncbi:MAG: isoprenylcysteine carboxylmethyltransferase family protein [Betaproteobacteria bacterium]|nr:isoprenylcysteine carboxylmethyltransferase family protein [Betaproteobacteria bacterium]
MTRIALTGRLLVAAQFALIAWLIWPFTPQRWSAPALALATCALAFGLWTLAHNRPGNFNIRPEPKASGRLVTGGPYRFVRHPMYSALLLFAAAEVMACRDPWKVAAFFALALVLYAKARLEERGLRGQFPDYATYAGKVRRFIPGFF